MDSRSRDLPYGMLRRGAPELVAAKQPALGGGGGKTATRREVLTRPGRLAEVTIE